VRNRPVPPHRGQVEAHVAARLGHLTGAAAFRAHLLRISFRAGAVAFRAAIEARDRDFFYRAADGIPESDFNAIFEVAARLADRPTGFRATTAAEKLAEEIAETCAARAAKIESAEIELRVGIGPRSACWSWPALGIKAILVVHLAFLGVGKNVVGLLHLLELFFRRLVAGIQVGMIFPREFSVRRADFLERRLARHAQKFVIVLFGGSCHDLLFA
jgi:hypothetical protein